MLYPQSNVNVYHALALSACLPSLALIFRMLRPGIALIKICQAGQLCGFRGKWWAIFYNLIRGGAADFSGKSEPPRSSAGNGEQKIRRLRRPPLDWLKPPLPPPPPILISMASSPITPPFPPSLPANFNFRRLHVCNFL